MIKPVALLIASVFTLGANIIPTCPPFCAGGKPPKSLPARRVALHLNLPHLPASPYREFAPPPRLAAHIECFWTLAASPTQHTHRVLPDGCIDIVFTASSLAPPRLHVAGPMTRPHHFLVPSSQSSAGVRFRPAMSHAFFPLPASRLTNEALPLEDIWGVRARNLLSRLADAENPLETVRELARELHPQPRPRTVELLTATILAHRGSITLHRLTKDAGVSARHLRRLFLDSTGLTPKQLCRIVRFRHAIEKSLHPRQCPDWARLALDCGYYDQAHLIRDFQVFAGTSPHAFMADLSNRQPAPTR